MRIARPDIDRTSNEAEIYNGIFNFAGKRILELGCGSAQHARAIAEAHPDCRIDALEVDRIQHDENLKLAGYPNIRFKEAGAEDIPAGDDTYDVVFMFKSLHHVPVDRMDQAMREIKRVLKPGGLAYISEPVFAGDYTEMMSLFHDEKEVRQKAFEAAKRAVDNGLFRLKDEIFFNAKRKFEDFADFEKKVLGATFVHHNLDDETYRKVKEKFSKNMGEDGAVFTTPIRVDLLENPAA